MSTINHIQRPHRPGVSFSPREWGPTFTLTMVALTIAAGVVIAIAVHVVGLYALLAVPGAFLFVAAIIKPDLGLMAFIAITHTQLSNVLIKHYGLPSIAQPLAALLGIVIILRITIHGERPLNWGFAAPLLAFYVTALYLSLFAASDYPTALETFIGVVKDILGGVIIILLIQRAPSLRRALWSIILAAAFMSTISAFQYLTGTFNNAYGGFGGWVAEYADSIGRHRLTGPYSNPNAYAQVLVIAIPLALDRLWHERKTWLRLLATYALIVCTVTVFLTFSRGGFLNLLATLAVLFLQHRPRLFSLAVTLALAVGLLQFVPPTYFERISTLFQLTPAHSSVVTDPSFRGRLSENTAAWLMFRDHPLTGVGLGNYRLHYLDYSRRIGLDPRRKARSPASLYLEILAEQGIFGIITFTLLMFFVFRGIREAAQRFAASGMRDEANMCLALFAGLAGYMLAAVVKNSAYANMFWVLIGVALGASQVARAHLLNTRDSLATGE